MVQPQQDRARGVRVRARLRALASVGLILIGALLAPVAVVGVSVSKQLVDTDGFVQTFAPLAHTPEVQSFIATEVASGIEQSLDIDALMSEAFSGVAQLNLPSVATPTLPMLERAAASGVRSLIATGTQTIVASPQFASLWEVALREAHSRAIAVLQQDPNALLHLDNSGTLSVSLTAVTARVRSALIDQGVLFATAIPVIDRTIPILTSESLVQVRTIYQGATVLGDWLPWAAAAALAAGLLLARNRLRALTWAAAGTAVSLLVLVGGLYAAKLAFLGAVSPATMPTATAEVVYSQLTQVTASTLFALVTFCSVVAIASWLMVRVRRAATEHGAYAEQGSDALPPKVSHN